MDSCPDDSYISYAGPQEILAHNGFTFGPGAADYAQEAQTLQDHGYSWADVQASLEEDHREEETP